MKTADIITMYILLRVYLVSKLLNILWNQRQSDSAVKDTEIKQIGMETRQL